MSLTLEQKWEPVVTIAETVTAQAKSKGAAKKSVDEDDDLDDDVPAKKGSTKSDADDDDDVDDDSDAAEEDDDWDPDFDEFDVPKSRKGGKADKEEEEEDFKPEEDDDLKELDLFNDSGMDDEEDDFLTSNNGHLACQTFEIKDAAQVTMQMLNWANRFNIFCFLDNQSYNNAPHTYECLMAAGAHTSLQGNYGDLKKLDAFVGENSWTFGHLSYELLYPLYKIQTAKKEQIGFPLFYFFKPQHVLYIKEAILYIEAEHPDLVYEELMAWGFEKVLPSPQIRLQQQFSKKEYIERVQQLQQHILRGDCYEINFCQEFFAEDAVVQPLQLFQNLMLLSPNPFSAFYKLDDKYLICASPERFITKQKNKILAQPMKGTTKRSADAKEDGVLKKLLQQSKKDQAENVMIVDLMRNDLSKICTQGSVMVEELFGAYSFPNVHQLISTIRGELKPNMPFSKIVDALFPMGSMTGAPKQRVLQLIDQYEPTARGIFSGSVGYISPDSDFDFNVVIRSIMYNQTTRYLSYQVGSGITFYSDAEQEWEECFLKAAAIKNVLGPLSPGGGT